MTSPRLGLDRNLRLTWLDAAAAVAARRLNTTETQVALMAALEGEVLGTTPQSGRGKTVTVLRRIWYAVPPHAASLRNLALSLLPEGDVQDRLALHWGMLLVTHPFFADLALVAGRALALQGGFDRSYVLRRLADRWGDRSTLARAVPRVLASMSEWGVLEHRDGQFAARACRLPVRTRHAAVLLEATVLASPSHTSSLGALPSSPMLFPFEVQGGLDQVRTSDRFSIHREGMDVDVVSIRR